MKSVLRNLELTKRAVEAEARSDEERVAIMREHYGKRIAAYSDDDVMTAWKSFIYSTNFKSFLGWLEKPEYDVKGRARANDNDQSA